MARILVVDDEHNIRMMIRLALQHEGHTVEVAADGAEGLEKFGNGEGWDLVLLDQRMPGMEGLAVLKQIRYYDPNARVIMITAFGTVDLAVDAMKAGATDFLRKPFMAETLRGAVQTAMETRSDADAARPAFSGLTFGMTTFNGYRIEFQPGPGLKIQEDLGFLFNVRRPDGESRQCTVVLSPVVMELIKAHVDRESLPGGDRFWQALCEEALANYIYQNADFPPESFLRVEELTTGLRRFVDAILTPG
jgi:CheY-like chemotaxis protein